jgi:predicted TIM-barrel fold metal-dependent hydrolase
MPRREFLATAVGLAVAAPFGGHAAEAAPRGGRQLIDTHTHFYDPTRPQGVPWPDRNDRLLYRRVLPADYLRLAGPEGVTGAVVVEASAWLEDNQWVLDLAAQEPFLVGLVGRLEPGRPEFKSQLDRFARNPRFRGIRVLHGQFQPGLNQPEFMADLKRLADQDLALDVNGGPEMLPAVAQLATALPALRLVINHVANLGIDGKTPPATWTDGMQAVAKHPNVHCKVSGLVEGSGRADGTAPRQVEFYQPVLEVLWRTFGPERLIYGSNWPVSERFASYATVQAIVTGFFRDKGSVAVERFFWRNAQKVYKYQA